MKQVDIGAFGFMGQIGGNEYSQAFGVLGPGRVVGGQAGQSPGLLHLPGVGIHDFSRFAVQTEAEIVLDLRLLTGHFLQGPHNEFEMGQIILFVFPDHQKAILIRGAPMQPMASIKHEDLKRGDAKVSDQLSQLLDVLPHDGSQVIGIVHVKSTLGALQNFRVELAVRTPLIQVILSCSHVVDAGSNSSHCSRAALRKRILFQCVVNPHVHVTVHHSREPQKLSAINHFLGLLGGNLGSDVNKGPLTDG